jgi:hypothetical protein
VRLKNGVIGSSAPVVHDDYYEAKKQAGLIGPPEQYQTSSLSDEAINNYIESWSVND